MRPHIALMTVGGIAGIFLARALEIESLLGKFGLMLAGMAVAWGIMKLVNKNG